MLDNTDTNLLEIVNQRVDGVLAKGEEAAREIRRLLLWVVLLGFVLIVVGAFIGGWQGTVPPSIVSGFLVWPITKLIRLWKERVALGLLPALSLIHGKKAYYDILQKISKKYL